MPRVCLMLCRLCLAAWCGAATLFVTIVLGLRNSPLFADEVRFNHPRVLFPLYYSMELPLLAVATLAVWAIVKTAGVGRHCRGFLMLAMLSSAAMTTALVDFVAVYRPLAEMLESQVLTARFTSLHEASRWLNEAVLLLSLLAGGVACWVNPPAPSEPPPPHTR